jgi:tripartite-type tricarboxylate transporter receptor subunit TctC
METLSTIRRLAAIAALAAATGAAAQSYPAKAVRLVVPFPPGGVTDIAARIVGGKLGEFWAQPVVIENRPGAGGMLGAEQAARAAPDGYTLLVATSGEIAINPALYRERMRYAPEKDFAPVALLTTTPLVFAVHPSVGASTVRQLIEIARRQPNSISYATPGLGGSHHLSGELFNILAGVRTQAVHYKGGAPAIADVVGGQVPLGIVAITPALPHLSSGRLRPIALTTARRSALLPEVPTLEESGLAGFDIAIWVGMFAPAGTPVEIVAKLSADTKRALEAHDVREKLAAQGADVGALALDRFGEFVRAETAKYAKIVRDAAIKLD